MGGGQPVAGVAASPRSDCIHVAATCPDQPPPSTPANCSHNHGRAFERSWASSRSLGLQHRTRVAGWGGKARCKLKAVPPRLLSTLTDRFLHGVCCRAPSALASPCCISQPGDREDRPMIPCLGAISPWWCGRQGSGGGGLPAMVGDEPGDSSTAILGEQRHTGSQADA